jgi:hypothetical protein
MRRSSSPHRRLSTTRLPRTDPAKAFAELLGESQVANWMAETLAEEKATDEKLTALAEGQVNPKATAASAEPRTESPGSPAPPSGFAAAV